MAPMIFFEAFVPSARKLFFHPMRFPIADAHYASGCAFLATMGRDGAYRRAVHFLEALIDTRSPGYSEYTWGYPFDWVTQGGTIKKRTPFITTVPYVYEAFEQVYRIDRNEKWLTIMQSIARHVYGDYIDFETSPTASSAAYSPRVNDTARVVNASAYRAFMLTKAACDLGEPRYREAADRNLNFVLDAQNPDGSWYYAADGGRQFVDHFHTCFVLKALAKIQQIAPSEKCTKAIGSGVRYYVANLFDGEGLPKPFSRAPRMTVYRNELYDCAECINLTVLLKDRHPELDRILSTVLADVLRRWRKSDGSFRSRKLIFGWDNVPMHRWAQSQLFRSLCFFLSRHAPARSAALEN